LGREQLASAPDSTSASTQPRRPSPRSIPSPLEKFLIQAPSPSPVPKSVRQGGPLFSSFPFTHRSSPPPPYRHNLAVMGRSLQVPLTPPMYSSPSSRAPTPPSMALTPPMFLLMISV
jgi:hypothetical protein